MRIILTDDKFRTFEFNRVSKLVMNEDCTTIGYTDSNGVYHEESNINPPSLYVIDRDKEDYL